MWHNNITYEIIPGFKDLLLQFTHIFNVTRNIKNQLQIPVLTALQAASVLFLA